MGRTKTEDILVRTTPDLRASFEEAFAAHGSLGSRNAFFEDCMRALIVAVRQKQKLVVPLELTAREKPKK